MDNVETIVAIYHAVKLGQPLTNRIFTVTGDAVCEPRNFYISIGTSYQELLDAAGRADQTGEENDFRRPDDGIRPV